MTQAKSDMFVLLLGAGFSAPWGIPVMSEFMTSAREKQRAADSAQDPLSVELRDHYRRLMAFVDEYRDTSTPFAGDWDNIEQIYTQADLRRLIDPTAGQELCDSIAWTIWDVCRSYDQAMACPIFDLFDRVTAKGLCPAVITTNYDLLVEWKWWTSRKGRDEPPYRLYYPGLEYWESASLNHVMHEDSSGILDARNRDAWQIPLVKLHGSANWLKVRDDATPDGKFIATSKFFASDMLELNGVRDAVRAEFPGDVAEAPAIIPPTLGKTAIEPLFQAQWKAAVECFSRAKHLVIVGYSFPSSDLFMVRLLTEGLRINGDLERIQVVDMKSKPKPTREWREQIADLFTDTTFHDKVTLNPNGTESFLAAFDLDG